MGHAGEVDTRDRRVTTGLFPAAHQAGRCREERGEQKEEEKLLQGDTFLAELTPAIEREMLETCQIPGSPRPDNLDTTVIHTPEPRSSTPQQRSAKSRRKRKPDGEHQTDVSDTGSEGFNSVD